MATLLPQTFRAFLALMLAVIGLQATPAQSLPAHIEHGSAFSASTAELALPVRREVAGAIRLAPALPAVPPVPIALREAFAGLADQPDRGRYQTGPPLRPEPLRRSPAPRAPPALS